MRDVLVPLEIDPSPAPPGSRPLALSGTAMGSGWSARLMLPGGADAHLLPALQAELDLVVAQMSHWEPDSLLSRYNRAAAGSWHALPSPFLEVIDYALSVQQASGGAYDPAAGALVDLWGFGATKRYDQAGYYAPDAQAIGAVLARRRHAQPVLDRQARRLLQPGGAVLDLSAVAKGHAVDRLALCLERLGIRHYLVEAGGELRGAGVKGDGQPWWVEIEGVPDAAAAGAQPLLALHGLAVATSGDYRRFYRQHAGGRISHTLDPRSGQPIANGVASCTVIAPTCMAADALSTALTVLGPREGLALAERDGIAARFLVRAAAANAVLTAITSSAWRALLQ
ncbi:FAD:protein FMN transferase [Herbaspirillum sp. SJZ107]|uniref:FAD:protein FMN transferase n=1 Tax=Herbaspirillum sp. SJZ107 TaxID=2572881 RepID=UPI00114E814E|nr:FAD:protein FMN transferase [Herbaspirillum sp. SJZ107]TQK07904.1 thiamine biosynthesis lipoprotein [Herbaspirillum sp. SJZ107]